MTDEELDLLVVEVRRAYGDRLPVPGRDESAAERERREAHTREVLDHVVVPDLDRTRLLNRIAPLTAEEHAALVELIVSEMFGLPRLLTVLRDPQVTDV
ncbi:MAG TPA: hypothetical protein PKZ82_10070, partial [Microthrixaceae bacterium]|nr:hypothetical protein [Microthrixaceae bacterium]